MATKVVKDEIIRLRVTSEQKEKLKRIAKEKNKTISEILSVATEKKIQELKIKMATKKIIKKVFWAKR